MSRSSTTAALLEAGPGFLFQVFGVGHIYNGRVGMGIAVMVSYWVLQAINLWLCAILIGFVTMPLTFLAYLIFSSATAASDAKKLYLT